MKNDDHQADVLKSFDSAVPGPGDFPYVRGPYRTMYRDKVWTMRQYSGFGSAKETNERFHYLLKAGQTGISCAFDLPTQMGYDSDHPMADGEVGRTGVAISSLEDMEILLAKIPLATISASMTINSTALTLLALYASVAKKRGIRLDSLRGTIQNDILKEYIARGTYIYPADFSLKLVSDSFRFAHHYLPKWNPISISGYHIREAGATAAQEIAFTLLNAFTYVEQAKQAGLALADFVPRLTFFFNVHNRFFEEIAKFRVARKIYAEEMRKRFDADPKWLALKFHAQTAGSTLTAQQPINNAVRVAYQAMAAVLGGAQSLHTNGFDEALALPTEESALLALRTQQILAAETGLVDEVDPMEGSVALAQWMERLENEIRGIFDLVESKGGVLACIRNGFIQGEIQRAAFEAQKKIDSGELKVVGVNCHQKDEKPFERLHRLNAKVARDQKSRLKKFKSKRKAALVDRALKNLDSEARKLSSEGSAHVGEALMTAIESKVTLGEMADVLRQVGGLATAFLFAILAGFGLMGEFSLWASPVSTSVSTSAPTSAIASRLKAVVAPLGKGVSFSVVTRDGKEVFAHDSRRLQSPASVAKLVSTGCALSKLGAAYQFETLFGTTGSIQGGVLKGPLIVRGGGDPRFVIEELREVLDRLRVLYGIKKIEGDLILDISYFGTSELSFSSDFDGDDHRAFNALLTAIPFNFNSFGAAAASFDGQIFAAILPQGISGLTLKNSVKIGARSSLSVHQASRSEIAIQGTLAPADEGRIFYRSLEKPLEALATQIVQRWIELGGQWPSPRYKTVEKMLPFKTLLTWKSPPLSKILLDVNKLSTNFASELIALRAGVEVGGLPATVAKAQRFLEDCWKSSRLDSSHFKMENASGLSRVTKMRTYDLAQFLAVVAQDRHYPEFASSLSVVGQDGTARRRLIDLSGHARVKTGSIKGVRTIAGYLFPKSGEALMFAHFYEGEKVGMVSEIEDRWMRELIENY